MGEQSYLFGLVLLPHERKLQLNNLDFQERIYLENIEASAAVLSKVAIDWKDLSPKLSVEALKATVKNLKAKVKLSQFS